MMIKSFLIIRFSEQQHFKATGMVESCASHSLPSVFLLNCTMPCGHDMKRHVTGVYKDSRRRTQEIKLQTIYGPICAQKKHHRKHLCSVSLFMTVYFYASLQNIFVAKFLFNFMLSIFFRFDWL